MRKGIAITLAAVLLLGCTGCGGQNAETGVGTAQEPVKETAADTAAEKTGEETAGTEEIELTMWSWSPITRTAEKMIAAFEEENPGIKINYTNYNYDPEYLAALAAASASGNLPDIVGLQPGALTQQYKDYLFDYSEYAVTDWGENWQDNFYKIASDQIRLGNAAEDNSSYILPVEAQVINIQYNKKMFDELGLKEPATYEELKEIAKTISDKGFAPLYFGGADGWQHVNMYLMVLSQIDTEIFDKAQNGEIAWTDAAFVKAMENYKKLYDDGIIQVGALSSHSYPDGVNAFTAGNAGMMALGSWWTQEFTAEGAAQNVQDWVFDNFYLPPIEEGLKTSSPIGGIDFGYGITVNCQNKDAAWKAIKSFSSGAGIQACADDLNNLPAFKGVEPKAALPENIVGQFNSAAKDLDISMNQRIGEPTIESALQNACAGVASGELTPEEGMKAVQEAQDKLQ